MNRCDLTLPSPAENLALDEALLDYSENEQPTEILRFWEPHQYFVVVGYANKVRSEVNLDYCRSHQIPIYRRCTGGGTILQGPGVLNYALVLRIDDHPTSPGIPATNQYVMERHRTALSGLVGDNIRVEGYTDLALGQLKFAGNAQRRRKRCLLFHGSFLLHLDLELVEKTLLMPSHQPAYRANRKHCAFLTNVGLSSTSVKDALASAWGALTRISSPPAFSIATLVQEKYSRDSWNFRY